MGSPETMASMVTHRLLAAMAQPADRVLMAVLAALEGHLRVVLVFLVVRALRIPVVLPVVVVARVELVLERHPQAKTTSAFQRVLMLEGALPLLGRCLAAGCRINKSAKTPRTFQLLLALDEEIS